MSGPQHCMISFGQTQLLLLIWLYCMLLLPCHVLPIYKRCIKIHSTDESHEVWSMDVQVVALCIMAYGNHRVYKRSSQFTDYTMDYTEGWTAVSLTTHYRLHGPGGEIFCTCPDQPWVPLSLLYNRYLVSFPGLVQSGRGNDHPPPSSTEVKERVKLYLYSPLWVFMACSKVNFTFLLWNFKLGIM